MKYILMILIMLVFTIRMFGKDYDIIKLGAVPDGTTLNTKVIQKAIDLTNKWNGGKVIVPSGTFLTGCLHLKSNVELHLEEGAVLLGSTNPLDYQKVKNIYSEGEDMRKDNSELGLILAMKASNIKISGKGKIDGQGLALALNVDSLHHSGILVDKNYNYRRMRPSELARPKLFRFMQCENIQIEDCTLTNSANWGLSFDLCRNLTLNNLEIINRAYWNNDGVDITDCKNVRITNCNVNSADDGICLKSYHADSCNDSIYIANCNIRTSASGIKFGTASYGGFRNITIENINVYDTFRSAIAIESVDGAVIENIRVNNVVAKNTGNALFIRLGHRKGENPGVVKNIHISNIDVEIPFGRPDIGYDLRGPEVNFFHNPFPASIVGIPGHEIENVTLENIKVTYPGRATKAMAYIPLSDLGRVPEKMKSYPEFSMFGELPAWAFYIRHAKGININKAELGLKNGDYRPAFVLDEVDNVELTHVKLNNEGSHPQAALRAVTNYQIDLPKDKIVVVPE